MRRHARVVLILLALIAQPLRAIEAPKTVSPTSNPSAASPAWRAPAQEPHALQPILARVTHRQLLANLNVEESVIDLLARAEVAQAVAQLSAKAETNDAPTNIALVRVQNWCSRILPRERHRAPKLLEQLQPQLSEPETARLQLLVNLQLDYEAKARNSCGEARFDYRLIEAQLRDAADEGEPLSLTELARIETRPARVEELLQQAASKNYAPALHALAMHRLIAVQRGERTSDVGSIRTLLKQAGRTSSRAKLDLANCMAVGCEGHPGDVGGALVFGLDAARDGERDAYASIARMPWAGRLPMEQRLAWQYFGQRMNEAGCYGSDYLSMYASLREAVLAYEKAIGADLQKPAEELAERYWRDYGARAQREQKCSP